MSSSELRTSMLSTKRIRSRTRAMGIIVHCDLRSRITNQFNLVISCDLKGTTRIDKNTAVVSDQFLAEM